MHPHVLWLDTRMDLLRRTELCALRKKMYKDQVRAIHERLPLKVMGPGGVAHAQEWLEKIQSGLDMLASMTMPVDVGWKEEWITQKEQVQCWRAILEEEKEVLLAFEDCVTQIKKLHNEVQEHWFSCPQGLHGMVEIGDGVEILEQVRLDYLMELEEEPDEENPEKNPYFPHQVRNHARFAYLGVEDVVPLIFDEASLHRAQEELMFQLEWLSKIPAMLQECTHEEVQGMDVPVFPYRQENVMMFLEEYRSLCARRRSWGRMFQPKYSLGAQLRSMHEIAKRVSDGQPFVEMVHVEAGRYRLESLGGRPFVLDRSFFISVVPVTSALFHFISPRKKAKLGDIPKTKCSWFQALHFCNILSELDGYEPCYRLGVGPDQIVWNREADGYRLPTEYEWEVAAQPGFSHRSHRWNRYLWSIEQTQECRDVAQKTPNHRCLYDMLGNVWEWCFDVYSSELEEGGDNGIRVVRGGSWRCCFAEFSLGMREGRTIERGYSDVGFRLVRNASIELT